MGARSPSALVAKRFAAPAARQDPGRWGHQATLAARPRDCRDPLGRVAGCRRRTPRGRDRKSTRLNSSHPSISYAVFCLKKKKQLAHIDTLEKKKKRSKLK